jgi:hypothetical protein
MRAPIHSHIVFFVHTVREAMGFLSPTCWRLFQSIAKNLSPFLPLIFTLCVQLQSQLFPRLRLMGVKRSSWRVLGC